jgi:aromatic ring-opening dioxygenase catalytic subunit (LigB family)
MARLPSLYITHGGGPCFWMEFGPPFGPHAFDKLRAYLAGLIAGLPERPKAILMISGHWEEDRPTVSTAPKPGMLFDYYGFPEHTYHLSYPAPGAPDLAQRVRGLLQAAKIDCGTDDRRGFDHGVFVPQLIIDQEAKIPVVMLSMRHDLDPAAHIAIGRALEPLRDEGVLIIGSGSSYHNLREFFTGRSAEASLAFDDWLNETVTAGDPETRNARLIDWAKAPGGRASHPREDPLIPLMVAAGAAGSDRAELAFNGTMVGHRLSAYHFRHS